MIFPDWGTAPETASEAALPLFQEWAVDWDGKAFALSHEALLEKYCAVCKERDELRAVVERVQQYVKRLEEECHHD